MSVAPVFATAGETLALDLPQYPLMRRTFPVSQPGVADARPPIAAASLHATVVDVDSSCRAMILRGASDERTRCERDLDRLGVPVPLPYRQIAGAVVPARETWLIAVRGCEGRCAGAFGVYVRPAPYLPGHVVLEVVRLGASLSPAIRRLALETLLDAVRRDPRVLRVTVEVFSRDGDEREDYAAHLAALGLKPFEWRNGYRQTLTLDLRLDENTIFAGFEPSARRNVRSLAKHPVTLAPIVDPRYADRLEGLMLETLARTGGRYAPQDWRAIIHLTREAPHLSRLVGILRNDADGPDALLAFAWGCAHGDHVQYSHGGSTRDVPFRIPLAYPLMWDLVTWGKRIGATWFDFGGVTDGTVGDAGDPLGGISTFKRFFSRNIVTVTDEWVYEPPSVRARAARMAHRWLSRV